ncbi:hypothetical protein T492DRAFT_936343 [Pavlovales sp. CCMP2436]|nr:hypothetical protein T492DRAFT_936343 [Pavlovales sp. CCMP2436]
MLCLRKRTLKTMIKKESGMRLSCTRENRKIRKAEKQKNRKDHSEREKRNREIEK